MEVQEESNGSKIQKKFDQSIKKLIAVIGGEKKLLPSRKVAADAIDTLVEELFAEEKQKNFEEAKKSLKEILEKYANFQKELKDKKRELDKLAEQKMDDFNKAAVILFDRLQGLNEREAEYYKGLKQAAESTDTTTTEPKEGEN